MTCSVMCLFASTAFAASTTLQRLIDEKKAGETLELEAKVYEGNVVIDKPMTIIGQKGTIIQGDETANVVEIESDDVTLDTLEVKGSGMSRSSREEYSGVRVMGNGTVLKNITVKESFHGVQSEEHTSELQSRGHLVCRLLLEKKKNNEDARKSQVIENANRILLRPRSKCHRRTPSDDRKRRDRN